MPFKIICPNGHPMMIHDQHAGRRMKCPSCGVGLVATRPAPVPIPSEPPRAVAPPPPPLVHPPSPPPVPSPVPPSLTSPSPPRPQAPLPPPAPTEEVIDYVPEEDPIAEPAAPPVEIRRRKKKTREEGGAGGKPVFWIIVGVTIFGFLAGLVVLWIFVFAPLLERFSFPPDPPTPMANVPFRTSESAFQEHLDRLKRQHGEKYVIIVCVKGLPEGESILVMKKLMKLGYKAENMPIAIQTGRKREFTWVPLAPVQNVSDLKNRIDFGRVVSVRTDRINIVADLSKFESLER